MITAELEFPNYSLMPYEKKFAIGELMNLLNAKEVRVGAKTVTAKIPQNKLQDAYLLTYFRTLSINGNCTTLQQSNAEGNGGRQSTRYSTHGLHEYKGKFNPQTARHLITSLVPDDLPILDPFCGSGTTLVEAAHLGRVAEGWDMNPFAVHLANTKVRTLRLDPIEIEHDANDLVQGLKSNGSLTKKTDARLEYLLKWFRPQELCFFEELRGKISAFPKTKDFFLTICSDLLRDYSLQEPGDLRIRRRHSPMPNENPKDVFLKRVQKELFKLKQQKLSVLKAQGKQTAYLVDARKGRTSTYQFGGAITSPPYFVALPYIDTQRLSLVWLGLSSPKEIRQLEASITGSREFRNTAERETHRKVKNGVYLKWPKELQVTYDELNSRTEATSAGFRTQAMPALFARFFTDMAQTFTAVKQVVKRGGRFALVVGQNNVGKGNNIFSINTPELLALVGESQGWGIQEIVPLDAYKRFSIHSKNSVKVEKLVILRRR